MYAILVDVTRCSGCEKCIDACIEANNLDYEKAQVDAVKSRDGLSADRLSTIVKLGDGHFARKSCMHCVEPSCVSACLVGGITKSPDGPVVYDAEKCIGCRYCMLACPFHIPRYEWDSPHPYMMKCAMCFERIKDNKLPACVEACPNQALKFGEREELISEAQKLIKQNPARYKNHIWGEHEFGGTSVIYISDVDLQKLNWPRTAEMSIPELTEPLISKTPFIGLGVMAGVLSLNWVIGRRMKRAREIEEENSESDSKIEKGHENE